MKSQFRKKCGTFHWEISVSCPEPRNGECYNTILSNVDQTFQTFSSKSGRGRLREVVTQKRFQIYWFALEIFGILKTGRCSEERWSLTTGGHNRRFDHNFPLELHLWLCVLPVGWVGEWVSEWLSEWLTEKGKLVNANRFVGNRGRLECVCESFAS